jgi:hypothetical protein
MKGALSLIGVILCGCGGPAIFQVNRIALIWAMLMNSCPAQNSLVHHRDSRSRKIAKDVAAGTLVRKNRWTTTPSFQHIGHH